MTEKKKNVKKTTTKAPVKTAAKIVEKPIKVMVSEDALPAIEIAKIYNITPFNFFAFKRKTGVDDNTLITISDFREKYQKAIKEGR